MSQKFLVLISLDGGMIIYENLSVFVVSRFMHCTIVLSAKAMFSIKKYPLSAASGNWIHIELYVTSYHASPVNFKPFYRKI